MSGAGDTTVTQLLVRWSAGDPGALEALIPKVYNELRRLASQYLRKEHGSQTLQSTALVHEAYLRLVKLERIRWQDRQHFFALAAEIMRRILVDQARRRKAAKRGAGALRLSVEEMEDVAGRMGLDLVALDEALEALSRLDPQQGRIVELRFFGGLSIEGAAAVLGISPATVKRDWRTARLWLHRELSRRSSRDV